MFFKIKICWKNIEIEKPDFLMLEKVISYTCGSKCIFLQFFIVTFFTDAKKVKQLVCPTLPPLLSFFPIIHVLLCLFRYLVT